MIRILFFLFSCCIVESALSQQTELFAQVAKGSLFIEHKVQPKENWYSIGRTYELSPKEIAPYNQLSLDKGLSIGQLVKIPLTESNFNQRSDSKIGTPVFHKVQPREGLFRIGEIHGVNMTLLKVWNGVNADQIKIGDKIIVGFLKRVEGNEVSAAVSSKVVSPETAVVLKPANQKQSATNSQNKQSNEVVVKPSTVQPVIKNEATEKQAPAISQTQSFPSATPQMGLGFFSTLYSQQSNAGKAQYLEGFIYGIFKSTSGWDDQKYYVLLNDVIPGTAIKITVKGTERIIYAKVLGAVPPGKESEGLSMRMSNATASALGLADTNAQLILDWFN